MAMSDRLLRAWYAGHPLLTLLRPLECLYRRVVERKRARFVAGEGEIYRPPVPLIVVGNITVVGTGKTPLALLKSPIEVAPMPKQNGGITS